jgi:hypothetical protein
MVQSPGDENLPTLDHMRSVLRVGMTRDAAAEGTFMISATIR